MKPLHIIIVLVLLLIVLTYLNYVSSCQESYTDNQFKYCYKRDKLMRDNTGKIYFKFQTPDGMKESQKLVMPSFDEMMAGASQPQCESDERGTNYAPGECGVCDQNNSQFKICMKGGDAKQHCEEMGGVFLGYAP